MPKVKIVKSETLRYSSYASICLLNDSEFIDVTKEDIEFVMSPEFISHFNGGNYAYSIVIKEDDVDVKQSDKMIAKFKDILKSVKTKIEKNKEAERKKKEQLAIKKKLAEQRKIDKARKLLIEKGIINDDNAQT